MDTDLLAFMGLAALLTILPGVDMALVMRSVLTEGRPAAWMTSLGICSGLCVHAFASALGLSTVLSTSAEAFTILKALGAAYLVYLGARTLYGTLAKHAGARGNGVGAAASETGDVSVVGHVPPEGGVPPVGGIPPIGGIHGTEDARGGWRAFQRGAISNVLNPKVAVFYLTVLPQFIRADDPVLLRSFLLAGIHIGLSLVWLTAYLWLLGRAGAVLARPPVRRGLERLTGTLLIALGVRLAWERR